MRKRLYPSRALADNAFAVRHSELAKTTFGFPRVVDVEWRIDYVVKSRHLEKVKRRCGLCSWLPFCRADLALGASCWQNYKPGYIVTLHTVDKQGQPKDITFACSVEELTVRSLVVVDHALFVPFSSSDSPPLLNCCDLTGSSRQLARCEQAGREDRQNGGVMGAGLGCAAAPGERERPRFRPTVVAAG